MLSAIVCWNVGQAKVDKLGYCMFFIEGRPLYRQHPTLNYDLHANLLNRNKIITILCRCSGSAKPSWLFLNCCIHLLNWSSHSIDSYTIL